MAPLREIELRGFAADFRHAVRLYARTPGASSIAVLVLAVGMACFSAFLSLYVDLALRPHPGFTQGARLATIRPSDGSYLRSTVDGVGRIADELAAVGAFAAAVDLDAELGPERENRTIELVSANFFAGLGPRLALGRGFERSEHVPEAEPVAVVSYDYWQRELGGDPGVLGTNIEIDRRQRTMTFISQDGELSREEEPDRPAIVYRIVGVMHEALPGVAAPETALWLPLEGAGGLLLDQVDRMTRLTLSGFIRRAPGVSMRALVRELQSRATNGDSGLRNLQLAVTEGVVRDINVQRDARRQLRLFLIGSLLLALVAAANVSLFLLARAPGRRRELGIRIAVGAPLKRLVRQLASEATVLVAAAAVLGLLLSLWLGAYLRSLAFLQRVEWRDVSLLDWRVLAMIGAFALVLAVLVSLAPILGLRRQGIARATRLVAARATLGQRIAGTAQLAIAGALGGAAIAFGWYLGSLTLADPGYDTENRYAIEISFAENPNASLDEVRRALEDGGLALARRRDAIDALPGVQAAALGSPIPAVQTTIARYQLPDPGNPAEEIEVSFGNIDSRFIGLLGLRFIHGRAPNDNELDVAVVNSTLARLLWGRDNVVGELLPARSQSDQAREIVGVLEDLSFEHPAAAVPAFAFLTGRGAFTQSAVVETSLSAADLQQAMNSIADGDFDIEAGKVESLQAARNKLIAPDRARGLLTIATAGLVVFLATFGFYGTQRYLVAAGRREYAIRASLGAGPRALGRLVFRRGLLLSLPGLVVGGLLAFIVVAWLRDDFVSRDISPALITIAIVMLLSSLMLAASIGPGREARLTQLAPLLRED